MIDLSDLNKKRLYISVFERDGGLEQLIETLCMVVPISQRQSEVVYELYSARVRFILGSIPDVRQLRTLSKHLHKARIIHGTGEMLSTQIAVLEDLIDDALEDAEASEVEHQLDQLAAKQLMALQMDEAQ